AETVREISVKANLTIAQTYPDFSNPLSIPDDRFVERASFRVIVALPASRLLEEESDNPDVIAGFRVSERFRDRIAAVLLDSGTAGRPGGTGEKFDWQTVVPITDLMGRLGMRLIVAGGLTPGDVGDAMRELTPWGVDVASGVEVRPGKKDPEKLRAFVQAVRDADRKTG
ncbi:MAG: phosphoribosylanthranilate isomerase, partial [Candidatus Sulfotelmatobacter sp.]